MAILDRNNIFQTQLFEKNVLAPYLKEYRNNTQFSKFMGGATAIIHNIMEQKGQGDTIVFPTRQTFMPIVKRGEEQLAGDESEITYVTDEVRIGNIRFATRITNEQLLKLQTKAQIDNDVRDDLLYQSSLINTKRVVSSFGLAFSPTTTNDRNLINYDWSYSDIATKMIACGIDANNAAGDAVSSQRVMFGQDFRTNEATVTAVAGAANFSVANGHTMSVKHIVRLVTLARTGGRTANLYKESAIRPYRVTNPHNGYADNRYILFISPEAYSHMRDNDADWRNQVVRGVIENQYQPSTLYGSAYKGSIEGVDVIVVDEFSNFITSSGNGATQVAYSVLCGASAIGFALGQNPTFATDERDYGMHKGIAHVEISGLKALKYPSKGNPALKGRNPLLVDNGIIHSFVKIS
jgi:hypothetical protein